MAQITLTNRARGMRTFDLPELGHDDHEVGTHERDAKTGASGHRTQTRRLPRSLTLCAAGTEGDSAIVDAEVLKNPTIAQLVRMRELSASEPQEAPAPPMQIPEPPALAPDQE